MNAMNMCDIYIYSEIILVIKASILIKTQYIEYGNNNDNNQIIRATINEN